MSAAERRESIVDAAAGVFCAAGYRAAKVSDVAARVGVTEPVVFQNFGSKSALFAAVLQRLASDIHAHLRALAVNHGPAIRLLGYILSQPPGGEDGERGSHHALLAEAAALAAEPGAGDDARRVARVITSHLADLVRLGQSEGDIRPDADPDAAAWLMLSVLATRPLRAAAMPGADSRERGVAELALRSLAPAALPT
jgi:AcrR family transcriptional regulator